MRIASVNAWGGALSDDLLKWLPDSGAEIVCLQEVTRTPGLSGRPGDDDGSLHVVLAYQPAVRDSPVAARRGFPSRTQ